MFAQTSSRAVFSSVPNIAFESPVFFPTKLAGVFYFSVFASAFYTAEMNLMFFEHALFYHYFLPTIPARYFFGSCSATVDSETGVRAKCFVISGNSLITDSAEHLIVQRF
jgi:hypothetical protein